MNKNEFINRLDLMFPNPKCELNYDSDYSLLIAILLSSQTKDSNVNKITPILFNKYKTLDDLKDANLIELENILKPLGLAKTKASNIKNLASILVTKYDSKVPVSRDILMSLPGIGFKTSGVFLAEFYNYNYIPVDTHVYRVSNRLGISTSKDTIKKVESDLESFFKGYKLNKLHLQLVLFGRHICKAKKPLCEKCLLKDYCLIFKTTTTDKLSKQ